MPDKYNPEIHHRRSIRLKDYDYSQAGAYYVTICIQGKVCLLGDIAGGVMALNDAGKMIENGGVNCLKNLSLSNWMDTLLCQTISTES